MGGEVALTRPHLVKATRVELGEAHKRMGLQRGAVGVSGGVRRYPFPFLQEERLAAELKLWVGSAWGGSGVQLSQQVLGGDRKGGEAVGAEEEKHRVGEGVKRKVGLVLSGGSGREPRERQPGPGVPPGKDSVVGGVALFRRGLK